MNYSEIADSLIESPSFIIGNQTHISSLCETIIDLGEEIGEDTNIFTLCFLLYKEDPESASEEDWDDLLEELMPILFCIEQKLRHEVDGDIVFYFNEDTENYTFTYETLLEM